jgi:hypothetical protein
MAVTGTNTFSVTRNEIIDAALRLLRVIGIGETPQTEDYTNCSQALNIMIKAWAKKGVPLWTTQDLVIPMVAGVGVYPIGPTAGYVYSVSSTGGTGYTAGTWTAVGGTTGTNASGTYTVVDGAPAVFTVTNAGTAYTTAPTSFTLSGAGTGATITGTIVGLTTNKPVRAFTAYIRDSNNNDTTLLPISKQEYDMQGNKFTQSVPNQFYYDNQLANANLYVLAIPQASGSSIYLNVERMFYDMTDGTDTFDFPQEWYQALKWGLAAEIAIEYGIEVDLIPYYEQKASMYLDESTSFSVEEPSVMFTMDYRGSRS